jgi:predicted N-acyltransferase
VNVINSGFTYELQIVDDPCTLPPEWDELLSQQVEPSLFMLRSYLAALHSSGSAIKQTGWQAHYLLLWRDKVLCAACPLYLKTHSRGEYVFDHSWANAYAEHGLAYYPKLLCAVPFTPVQGSRLLALDDAARSALLEAAQAQARLMGASSIHMLFCTETDRLAAEQAGWSMRKTVQFHWQNSTPVHTDFDSFLKTLTQDKAKKARAEMRKVTEAGVTWRYVLAAEATLKEQEFLVRCYTQTYHEHGNEPYLSPAFFANIFQAMPQHWLLCIASHPEFEEGDFACSLIGIDSTRRVAYGRYWGALARVSYLHFDACYYQPLKWCVAQGYERFEGGAQGEHKMARGLLPVTTHSMHYIADPQFAEAIVRFTEREQVGIEGYVEALAAHSPIRTPQ